MKKMQTKRLSLLLCLCLLISLFTFPQAAFATETDIAQLDAPAEDGAGTKTVLYNDGTLIMNIAPEYQEDAAFEHGGVRSEYSAYTFSAGMSELGIVEKETSSEEKAEDAEKEDETLEGTEASQGEGYTAVPWGLARNSSIPEIEGSSNPMDFEITEQINVSAIGSTTLNVTPIVISNNGNPDSLNIDSITATAGENWTLVPASTDFDALENDARQISISAAGVDLSTGAYTDAGKVSASSSKQISMTGKTGLVTEAITGETVASVVVTVSPSLETSWENATDATIVAMVEAADAGQIDLSDFWNVGDEREVMLSAMAAGTVAEAHDAQTVTMVLLNDGGRTLADGNECNFVVGLKDVLNTGGIPNEEVTTVGGWGASTRRAWCNNEFYNAIPDSLRPIFKQFYNPTSEGQGSSAIVETLDYFTLPSASEVLTEITAAFSGEGSILEYYANGYGVKYCAGSPLWYWLRSPDVAGYYYVHVYYPGYSEPGDEIGPGGISPHGCI